MEVNGESYDQISQTLRKEIVEILKAGCSPNMRSKMGNTPFSAAFGARGKD